MLCSSDFMDDVTFLHNNRRCEKLNMKQQDLTLQRILKLMYRPPGATYTRPGTESDIYDCFVLISACSLI